MKGGHYLHRCLLFLLVKTVVSVSINIVLIEDNDESITRMATRKAFESIEEAKIDLEVVTVSKTTTANQLCDLIFKEDKNPTLVIDSLRQTYFEQNKLRDSLRLLLRNMGVPTISFSQNFSPWPGPPLTDVEKQYLIHIIPPELIMSQIVKSIIPLVGGRKTAILFETITFGVLKNKAGLIFDNIGSGIIMEEINGEAAITSVLQRTKGSGATNIFVFASEIMATKILTMASTSDGSLFNKEYAWFVLTKDETKLVCKDFKSNAKVMLIQPSVLNNETKNEVNSISIGSKIEKSFYYDFFRHMSTLLHKNVGVEEGWPETLTFSTCGNLTAEENKVEREKIKLRDHLEAMQASETLKGTFGNFVIKNKESRKPFGRQDIRMKISMVTYQMGTSNIKDELEWQYSELKKPADQFIGNTDSVKKHKGSLLIVITTNHDCHSQSTSSYHGVYERIVIPGRELQASGTGLMMNPPFVFKSVKNKKVVFEGLCIDLLEIVKKESNLTFEYVITENIDQKHGDMNRHGSFDGMIGDIVKGKADMAIGPITINYERELVVDFTVPFYDLVGFSILMKRKKVEPELYKFLTVLETDVWGCIVAAYFLTSFLLFLFDRLSPYSFYNNQEKYKDDDEKREFSLKESLWFCYTSLTPQGGGEAPKNLSGRLVSATWWLFGFIIIASYTANLAAFLTVSRLDYTIENIDDLSKQYKIKFSTVKGSLAYNYYEKMKTIEERFYEIWKDMSLDDSLNETERAKLAVWDYPVSDYFTKIWWTMQEARFYSNLNEGISKTLNNPAKDGYAFLGESFEVQFAALQHCELKQVGPEFVKRPIAWAIKKGSSLYKPFSEVFLKVQNERRLEQLKDKWWNHNPYHKKCYHYVKRNDGIELDNIGGIFYVMFGGVAFALISLIIEFIYFKSVPSKKKVITVRALKEPSFAPSTSFN